jgi:hypothetical protein
MATSPTRKPNDVGCAETGAMMVKLAALNAVAASRILKDVLMSLSPIRLKP